MREWLNTFRPQQVVAIFVGMAGVGHLKGPRRGIEMPLEMAAFLFDNRQHFPYRNITAQRALRVLDEIGDVR